MKIKTVLFPTDFSERSVLAYYLAGLLAREHNARLVVLHAVPRAQPRQAGGVLASAPEGFDQEMRTYGEDMRAKLNKVHPAESGVAIERVFKEGDVANAILETAEEMHCDVIVLGTHGVGVKSGPMGSVAERVMAKANCPVIAAKALGGFARKLSEQFVDSGVELC